VSFIKFLILRQFLTFAWFQKFFHRSRRICQILELFGVQASPSVPFLMSENIGFAVYPNESVDGSVLEACSYNFSNYYGIWQTKSRGRVKMSAKALARSYLNENCQLVVAFDKTLENIIGHAFFKVFYSATIGCNVAWFTQLVVKTEYRHKKIAQRMLSAAISPGIGCAGLATTHPYAVMALEKAMRKKVDPFISKVVASKIVEESRIDYLCNCSLVMEGDFCLVNTDFHVDHAEPENALAALEPASWVLGSLLDGHEFIAIIIA